tara:strand:- start:6247 stop:7416 length:1170 start_codon:yes stop_codon:yes gene_type:complete
MLFKDIYSWLYIIIASGMIAIGRLYDERLELGGVNFSIILSLLFILFSIPFLPSIKNVKICSSKMYLFIFLLLVVLSPILWFPYGFTEYGLYKYINFIFVVIPLVLISSIFTYQDVRRLFLTLLYFIFFLAILGVVIVSSSTERLSVLGGGPIVFARWMIIGIIILFFLKQKSLKNSILIIGLFVLSISTGSRGPILSLLLTAVIFFLLNFQNIFFKFIFIIFILTSFLFVFDSLNIQEIGKTERLVTKDNTSKNARLYFAFRSLELLSIYPTGVGIGNWQEYSNKTKKYHLLKHDYPHNLILEVFSELGLLGGIVLLLVLLKSIYFTFFRMLRYSKENSIYNLLFYLQLFLLFNSMFSGDLNDSRFLFIIISISLISEPLLKKRINEN